MSWAQGSVTCRGPVFICMLTGGNARGICLSTYFTLPRVLALVHLFPFSFYFSAWDCLRIAINVSSLVGVLIFFCPIFFQPSIFFSFCICLCPLFLQFLLPFLCFVLFFFILFNLSLRLFLSHQFLFICFFLFFLSFHLPFLCFFVFFFIFCHCLQCPSFSTICLFCCIFFLFPVFLSFRLPFPCFVLPSTPISHGVPSLLPSFLSPPTIQHFPSMYFFFFPQFPPLPSLFPLFHSYFPLIITSLSRCSLLHFFHSYFPH